MAEVAEIVALEMSKYLTKEASMAGVRKKINRPRAWVQHCQVKPDPEPMTITVLLSWAEWMMPFSQTGTTPTLREEHVSFKKCHAGYKDR